MAYDDRDEDEIDISRSRRPAEDIPNYLVQSILVTLCCCLPLGIVAIINAAKVNTYVAQGDYQKAREASDAAKKWSTIGAIVGVIVNILSLIVRIAAESGGNRRF